MSKANRLPPHPLVVGLTAATQKDAEPAMASNLAQEAADDVAGQLQARATGDKPDVDEPAVEAFTKDRQLHYTLVAGYLGGVTQQRSGPEMQVLYIDAGLKGWLLVPFDSIAIFNRVSDKSSAFGLRDVLWLKPGTRVVRGDETSSVANSYLSGPFLRAEELSSTFGGGTYPRTDGLLVEALTPACCSRSR
jgi:hypothetical protein